VQNSDLPQPPPPDNLGNRSPARTCSPITTLFATAGSAEGPFLPENNTMVPSPKEMVPKSGLPEPPASPNSSVDLPDSALSPIIPLPTSDENTKEAWPLEDKLLLPLLSKEKELLENFGPDHPEVLSLRSQMEVVRRYIARQQAKSPKIRRAEPPIEATALRPLQEGESDRVQKTSPPSPAEVDSAPTAAAAAVGHRGPISHEDQASPPEGLSSQSQVQSQAPAKPAEVRERIAAAEAEPVMSLEVSYTLWQVVSVVAAFLAGMVLRGMIRRRQGLPSSLQVHLVNAFPTPSGGASLEFHAEPIPVEHKVIDPRMPSGERGLGCPSNKTAVQPVDLDSPRPGARDRPEIAARRKEEALVPQRCEDDLLLRELVHHFGAAK
jgi:hypothetical protein